MDQPTIEYPCIWIYKIIGQEETVLRDAVKSCMVNKDYTLTMSKSSSGGKYLSFSLEVNVTDECERNDLFACLKNHPAVNYIL